MRRFLFAFFALCLVGCGGGGSSHPAAPYVNRFLLNVDVADECITATIKIPEDYVGYLTLNDDPEAAVFRYLDDIDGRRGNVEGTSVTITTIAICTVNLDEVNDLTLELVWEPQSAPPPNKFGAGPTPPFGTYLVEVVANLVMVDEVEEPEEPEEPEEEPEEPEDLCLPELDFLATAPVDFGNSERLQLVIDTAHMGLASRIDVTTDAVAQDTAWVIDSPDGDGPTETSAAAIIIVELAGFKDINVFGVYDVDNPGVKVVLFTGEDGVANYPTPAAKAILQIDVNGFVTVNDETVAVFASQRFGFFLDSSAAGEAGGVFYSDSRLNSGAIDHMVAYQGDNDVIIYPGVGYPYEVFRSNEFIIGFEDLLGGGDLDYEDFVVLVSGIRPNTCPVELPEQKQPQ